MAQLDRFLSALTEYSAEALVLEENHPPAFRFLSGTKSVSKQVLDAERILALVTELASPQVLRAFRDDGTASFHYRMGTKNYSGILEEDSGAVVATIWEQTQQQAEAMRDPQSHTGADAPAARVEEEETSFADVAAALTQIPPEPEHSAPSSAAAPPAAAASEPTPEVFSVSRAVTPVDAAPPAPAVATPPGESIAPIELPTLGEHTQAQDVPNDLPDLYRAQMDELLRTMVERGASDLHLCCHQNPAFRVDGQVQPDASMPIEEAEHLYRMLFSITPQRNRDEFLRTHDTDFAYAIEGVSRYRVNLFFDRHGPGAVIRAIPDEIIPAEKLGLTPEVMELASLNKGLVLVTGPTGSGKSTTLAGILDLVNSSRQDHIITIEDPIEFVHPNKKCLVNQREVGVHTDSFKAALRAALREDPDVILVGELRDLETVEIAIETAETGHLVFGTLHTTTAASTVDRIIDQFPADRQAQIRVMLSESLRAVISQTLLRKKGGGRVAASEILLATPSISNLIREGKTFQIESQMQTGKKYGMRTLNDHLLELVQKDLVTPSDAYLKAVNKSALKELFERNGIAL